MFFLKLVLASFFYDFGETFFRFLEKPLFWGGPLLDPQKTRARASFSPFFSILSEIRVPRTRVFTPRTHVFISFSNESDCFFMKIELFPSFGRQTNEKNSVLMRKIRGFSISAKAETCIFTVSQALFKPKIAAKCKETAFFHFGSVALV